jgi:hypothetical protein
MLVFAIPAVAQQHSERVGESITLGIERDARNQESVERLAHQGGSWIKVHFAEVAIEPGGSIRVVGEDGRVGIELTAGGQDIWAAALDGASVTIEARNARYRIDRYGAGHPGGQPEVVLGGDDRRDRECFGGEYKWHTAEAVGRMLFEADTGGFFVCTGSVISSGNHFLTNNHCVATQSEVNSLEVRFNYDRTTCGGAAVKAYDTHFGGTFLQTNAGLDYTLLRLNNHTDGHTAAGSHGYLEIRGQTPSDGELLYLPQHPGGNPKTITDTNCTVLLANYNEPGYAANSSIQHECDTEGGSSGSPVLNLNNQIVALHHTGYTGSHNGAIRMNRIQPLIEGFLPATGGGSRTGATGWVWYKPQEAWFYTQTDQNRVWVYLQNSSDYLWADAVRESSITSMLKEAVENNHWLGVFWTGATTYSNVRLWWN